MANVMLNPAMLAMEALQLLTRNPLPPGHLENGRDFRLHDTVMVRIPQPLTPFNPNAAILSIQRQQAVHLDRYERASLPIGSFDLLKTIDRFSEEFLVFPMGIVAGCLMRSPHIVVGRQELPGGLDWSQRINDPRSGISLRLLRWYDARNNLMPVAIDLLYGTY